MTLPKIGVQGSLTVRTYEALKEAIVNKQLQPNQPLYEEKLAEQLGVSRTPLRAALQKLEYERLVTLVSGRGYMVASLNRADMEHVLFMRGLLEPEAARLAAECRRGEDVARLDKLVSQQESCINDGEYLNFLSYDREFHLAIASISQNPYLKSAVATMQLHGHRFLVLDKTVHARASGSLQEHRTLVRLIETGDSKEAEKIALEHVEKTERMLAGVLLER